MTQSDDNSLAGTTPPLKLVKAWYFIGAMLLLGVALVSLMPAPDIGVSDKLSHLVTYFILSGWFSLLADKRTSLVWTVLGLVGFGILIELLQGMTAYRYPERGDVLANGAGVLAGILVYFSPLPRFLRFVDTSLARILLR